MSRRSLEAQRLRIQHCHCISVWILLLFFNSHDFSKYFLSYSLYFYFLLFRGAPAAYGSPRLGVKLEVQLLASTTGMPDPSYVCSLHPNSRQCLILNPLSKVWDWTCNLMVPSQIHSHCTTAGTPKVLFLNA